MPLFPRSTRSVMELTVPADTRLPESLPTGRLSHVCRHPRHEVLVCNIPTKSVSCFHKRGIAATKRGHGHFTHGCPALFLHPAVATVAAYALVLGRRESISPSKVAFKILSDNGAKGLSFLNKGLLALAVRWPCS